MSRDSSTRQVLVVEDDADTREALREMLEGHGYRVAMAEHGAAALEQLRSGHIPDAILLDLRMPVMDGWQFRALQRQEPQLSQAPVIAMSAEGSFQAAAIDAARFLSKPLNHQELLKALAQVIAADHARRAQEQHLAQAQAERMSALGTLAAGAAHEINNPLAYVIANLGFVGDELSDLDDELRKRESPSSPLLERLTEIREAVTECRDGAERIRVVTQGLKVFSRAEEETLANVNVVDVVSTAIKMVGNELRHRARLVREFQPVPPVRANEARLGQVFVNLLVNAAQAIAEGNVAGNEVRVSTRLDEEGFVVARVSDTGHGIAPENLSRIFDPFFTTKPIGVGTGLGLSVCHGIIRSLGGDLTVESVPGKGSTFEVRLPRAPETEIVTDADDEPVTQDGPRGRILVIDDEPIIGAAIRRTLADHEVIACTDAQSALERIRAGEWFDVIFCDVMMPQITGIEAYEQLRTLNAELAERVVFLSGGAFTERAQKFLESVSNRRMDKPFSPDALRALVRELLARH